MAITAVTTLKAAFDTFPNLYDVEVTFPTFSPHPKKESTTGIDSTAMDSITILAGSWNVRASSVTLPELTVNTYKVDYKGIDLTRPNAEITGERKLSIKFRVDADYALYKKLLQWKRLYGRDSAEGQILDIKSASATGDTDLVKKTGTIRIYGLKPKGTLDDANSAGAPDTAARPIWTFNKVACTKIGVPTFARESSAIIEVETSFIFTSYSLAFS